MELCTRQTHDFGAPRPLRKSACSGPAPATPYLQKRVRTTAPSFSTSIFRSVRPVFVPRSSRNPFQILRVSSARPRQCSRRAPAAVFGHAAAVLLFGLFCYIQLALDKSLQLPLSASVPTPFSNYFLEQLEFAELEPIRAARQKSSSLQQSLY